jgi:uncharacterized membrane protein
MEDRGVPFDAFQTSLPLRLDYEAMLAYMLLPPAGPVLLLLLEHKSDYVRYGCTDNMAGGIGCGHAHIVRHLQIPCLAIKHALRLHLCGFKTPLQQLLFRLISSQIVHLVFSWSPVLSWILFAGDLILIGFLALHAYRDGR